VAAATAFPGTIEVSPGIWRIRLPFHLELNHVNVHLLKLSDGWMLIDVGVPTPDSRAALEAGIRDAGASWNTIRAILITHCHPDHVGNLGYALEASGAALMMHPLESDTLERFSAPNAGAALDAHLELWGAPAALIESIQRDMSGSWRQFQWRQPDRLLAGGETLTSANGPLDVIWTPGHARGHLCLYVRAAKVLISGDHLLPTITPNISWIRGADALDAYLVALKSVDRLDAVIALPSHGDPFHNVRERAAQTAAHHEDRCDRIVAALEGGPRTAHQIAVALWGDTLSPFQHRFGLYEVMAHLVYLERRERVRVLDGAPQQWAAAD
jgi:glyoxylase-like metal-dependent hydrolase (beta-lactamase superfamily II)